MKPIRLMSGFFTVGIWTLISRVMGFIRDVMIAGYLGSGPAAEAFLVAFSLPNMFRRHRDRRYRHALAGLVDGIRLRGR